MTDNSLESPLAFLERAFDGEPLEFDLTRYEQWWRDTGQSISEAIDQAGTPRLKMFDQRGRRIDQIGYDSGYRQMLASGYRAGIVWRVFSQNELTPFFHFGYLTAFFDPGLYCPYTVTLGLAHVLHKYGSQTLQQRFMPHLLKRDDSFWQGATWMTEIGGGSDLGATVKTHATPAGEGRWRLNGEKYFASNVGAELAVVAARPDDAPGGIHGLALFLVPRQRQDGTLNYHVRRLKDKIGTRSVPTGEVELRNSEAWLIGKASEGIYLIMEILNISRVANSIASIALAQRAIRDAARFAAGRELFGGYLIRKPMAKQQFRYRLSMLNAGFRLAWEAVDLLNNVWRLEPPYSDRYLLFRLVAHLAKYWTAEFAAQTAKWGMELHGGLGALAEFPPERHFREAMILNIWEGTPHRQMLDALQIMREKKAHHLLREHLASETPRALNEINEKIDTLLAMPEHMQEEKIEPLFRQLALTVAKRLLHRDRHAALSRSLP